MPKTLFSNAASTTVTAGGGTSPVSGTVETWTVLSSTLFPAASNTANPATAFFIADPALPGEVMQVTNVTGVTWTVVRGAEGTIPVTHATGFTVDEVISAGTLAGIGVTDWLNVKTVFGAKIDGSTNDATAWQNAINAVQGTTYGLYFPSGTSIIGSPLSMTAPVALMGAGRDFSILQLANGVNDYAIKFTQGTGIAITGAKFSDFQINGNAVNQTAGGGISAVGAVECNFERIHFTNMYNWGLALQAIPGGAFGHHNKIYACTFDNAANAGFGGGGWATSSDENLWLSCDFQFLGGASAPVGTYPVMLLDQAGLQHIENCVFVGSRGGNTNVLGVRIHNAGQTKVEGCTFDGVGGDGVFINNADCIITGNTFTSVADQAATAGVFAGVHLEFGTIRNIVANNNFSSSSTANKTGYLIREESTGGAGPNLIEGNTLHIQGTVAVAPVSSAGTGTIVRNNTGYPTGTKYFTDPTQYGADPSGTNDSTAAFAQAIAQLGGPGTVMIPQGTFKITPVSATVPALTIPSGVILQGAGKGATTLLKGGNGPLLDFSGQGPNPQTTNWSIYQGLRDLTLNANNKTGLLERLYYVQFYDEYNVNILAGPDVSVDCAQMYDSRFINGLYQFGGSTSSSTISGGQAVTHLIRNSAAGKSTLSAPISGTITSIPVVALTAAIPAGIVQVWHGGNFQNFTTTGAAATATSIPVTSTLVTLTGATTGDVVNGFGWSSDSSNASSFIGCHWENNWSGAVWITAGPNNTANVNNMHFNDFKCEQDQISFNCPQIQVDASSNSIHFRDGYVYLGAFANAFATPVAGIYYRAGYGSISGIDMGNGGVACVSSGIDVSTTALSPALTDINQWWNTSPTVAGINVGTGVVFMVNIQIGGTVTTKIAGAGGSYTVVNDPNSAVSFANTLTSGAASIFGNVDIKNIGAGLQVAEGTNAKQGTAVLVAGSKVVANTSVTANSRIFLTSNADGGTPGFLRVSARTAGTSFTITSSSGTDTSTVAYEIIEPG